jgi:hypothetical protein
MAETRSTRTAVDEEEPAAKQRQPRRRREREPVGGYEPGLAEDDEPERAQDDDDPERADDDEPRDDSTLSAKQAARAALQQVMELTAKEAESVTEVERTKDGWVVGVEVVEDRRIPSSADILATYRATINTEGELMSYRRVGRYSRGRGGLGEGS